VSVPSSAESASPVSISFLTPDRFLRGPLPQNGDARVVE
jgi:hypothetical protein